MRPLRSLSNAADFARAFNGSRARSDGLVVHALVRGDLGPSRAGLAVPRSIGGAVARNRMKRRLRASLGRLASPQGVDLVVKVRPEAASLSFQELGEHLYNALAGAGATR